EISETAAAVQSYLDSLAAQRKLSGVVVVAKSGYVIASKAAGVANRTSNEPITLETKFNLGSMNNMFTAVAIAQLVQDGRLRFDDTVGQHLTDYPNKDVAEKVTLHHLLTHSSGLASYWGEEFNEKRETLLNVRDHLPIIAKQGLSFTPGEKFQYSNSGFMLLGAIIEKVTGESYYDYVQRNIYDRAGMTDTGFYDPKQPAAKLAIGYTKARDGSDKETENTGVREVRGGPAGGGYSTAADMLKFHRALDEKKLLDAQHTKLVMTGKVESGEPIGKYAYGFGDTEANGRHIVGHNGGGPGIAANFDMFPDNDYTAVIFMKRDRLMTPVIFKLRELIPAP
ncbi:MAG TPA: serine hydrolase domain-containing protein, partial [Chthoniobacterales bacterium]|nr:serine hydrolase domain-containing protein [Chthoniobacterales bacterium]